MNKSSKGKTPKTPLGLVFSAYTADDDRKYFHANLHIIRWGDDDEIRNVGDEAINGFFLLNNLSITSQGNETDPSPRKLYGWSIRYMRPYAVEYRDAERMYRTLRKILDKLDRVTEKRGHPKTFADYVQRFAEVIGVTSILYCADSKKGALSYSERDYRVLPLGEGINHIDAVIRKWESGQIVEVA